MSIYRPLYFIAKRELPFRKNNRLIQIIAALIDKLHRKRVPKKNILT